MTYFRFPIPYYEDYSHNIKLCSKRAKIIAEEKIIFIYKWSMIICKFIDCLNMFLKSLIYSNEPIGGKPVMLMGYFWQIFHVFWGGRRENVVKTLSNKLNSGK